MRGRISINAEIMSPDEAQISVFDRGFLYGDSVYEVLRVYNGLPLALTEHLERLQASATLIGFQLPWAPGEICDIVMGTLRASGLGDAVLRVIATRGSGALGLDPSLAVSPQLVVMALERSPLPPEAYQHGRAARVVSVARNLRQALDPQAKTGNYMNSILALQEARAAGADEAIMLDHLGRVAEAATASVFAWYDGSWHTPSREVGILDGITRRMLLELCAREKIPCCECALTAAELHTAEALFVCSTLREILPIVRLDDHPVGQGTVDERTKALMLLYRQEVLCRTDRSPA